MLDNSFHRREGFGSLFLLFGFLAGLVFLPGLLLRLRLLTLLFLSALPVLLLGLTILVTLVDLFYDLAGLVRLLLLLIFSLLA